MRDQRPTNPTHFRGLLGIQEVRLLALPPDEADPDTDYLWRAGAPEHPQWPVGTGFTSHQAVHDLLEQLEATGVVIEKVNQIHDSA